MRNEITFKEPSLRETIVHALDYIGVDIEDFNLKEEYFNNPGHHGHDARHLYRVMTDCALIAYATQEDSRRGLLAFCGAFIHDLGKYGQGDGREHGRTSVNQKWDLFNALWDKYALTDEERQKVKYAVIRHSGGELTEEEKRYASDFIVNRILTDADAFDRARFHKHGRLDWNGLRLPKLKVEGDRPNAYTQRLISESEALAGYTAFTSNKLTYCDFLANVR
jgi:hypothetical protein